MAQPGLAVPEPQVPPPRLRGNHCGWHASSWTEHGPRAALKNGGMAQANPHPWLVVTDEVLWWPRPPPGSDHRGAEWQLVPMFSCGPRHVEAASVDAKGRGVRVDWTVVTPTLREPGRQPSLSVSGTPDTVAIHPCCLPTIAGSAFLGVRRASGQEGPRRGQPPPRTFDSWPLLLGLSGCLPVVSSQ